MVRAGSCQDVAATLRLLDPFSLEILGQPLLQRPHRLGQRVRLVVLEDQTAVVQRPHHETEHFLVADLDVAVASDPLGDGGEQLLDARLLPGRLDHADPVGFSQLPQVGLVGFLHLGQFLLHGNVDAEFRQVGE
jgi:hypothetical protein